MYKKYLLLPIILIGTAITAADNANNKGTAISVAENTNNRQIPRRPLRPTPPATPPIHNSPQTTKKEHADIFAVSANQIGIKTKTGVEQDLQTYLHHTIHHIHEELIDLKKELQKETSDLHAKTDVQTSTLNDALKNHEQHVTKQIQEQIHSTKTTHPEKLTVVTIGEGQIRTVDQAFHYLEQQSEYNTKEIKEIKDAHNKRLSELESAQGPATKSEEHKSWSRWIMDHFVASALVATGLYHSSALCGTLTQVFPTLLRSTVITKALPYISIPAGIVFLGTLTADIHHNLRYAPFAKHRNDWKAYFNSSRWIPFKQPSDFLVSTAVITKAFTDNIYHVVKPACKMVLNTGIVQLMLAAGATAALAQAPKTFNF